MYWTKERLKEFAADIYDADNYSGVMKKHNISENHAHVIAAIHKFPHPKISARHGGRRNPPGGRPRKIKREGDVNDKKNTSRAVFPHMWILPSGTANESR